MDYTLKAGRGDDTSQTFGSAFDTLKPLLADQKGNSVIALTCVVISTLSSLLTPALIARVVDTAIARHDYPLLIRDAALLAAVYVVALATSYFQTICMGTVGRNTLFKLRNALFTKLSILPIAFFAQNKIGDLPVPSGMIGRGNHYALEVTGDSMINAGILDGDTVIIQEADSANTGEIIVALVDNEEATLKRLRRRGDSIALEAANPAYETRLYGSDRVEVQGKLVGLIRRY